MVARVGGAKSKRVTASFWAAELSDFNYGWKMVNGTCGGTGFTLGPTASKRCEEFTARLGHSSASFEDRGWTIRVTGHPPPWRGESKFAEEARARCESWHELRHGRSTP